MVCITNLATSRVHLPPDGRVAGEPTFPNIFFEGIDFDTNKNWIGPLRKMSGKGAVNGQRTYVYGTAPTLPYFPEPVMYQTSGDFTIDLTPGKWRISIEHGNEYIPIIQEVDVTGKQKDLLETFILKRWINMPQRGWYSGDVHTHHPLNKQRYRDYVMQLAQAENVHLVNVLQMGDRKNMYFEPEGFGRKFQICKMNICIASGQEEPRSDYGHIIGLNIEALARDTAFYNYYDVVFDKIHHKNEALVGYAHFAYGGEGVREGLAMYAPSGSIDFVELLQNTQLNSQDYYDYLNLGFKLSAAAGSDFPWGSTIGDGRTFVYTGNPFSADKWFTGMKAGNTFVSNGPALFLTVDGKLPGSEINRRKGALVNVAVKALSNAAIGTISKIQLYNNGALLHEKFNTDHRDSLSIKLPLKLFNSQWITAAVYCTNGALAHTSPVYCIIDGKPFYDSQKGPAIIKKLLLILDNTELAEKTKSLIDNGIIDRINNARTFYTNLLDQMKNNRLF